MIDALNELRIRWRGRETEYAKAADQASFGDRRQIQGQVAAVRQCIQELSDTIDSVKPRPLNEASTQKLYRWAGRMVRIMDLMVEARGCTDEPDAAIIAGQLAELATQDFLNDIYDLMKQLANRQSGA